MAKFEGNDEIYQAAMDAASVMVDEFCKQNGLEDVADDHDEWWYDLQEELCKRFLNVATQLFENEEV